MFEPALADVHSRWRGLWRAGWGTGNGSAVDWVSSRTEVVVATAADEQFMRVALAEARSATGHGDVPIGAVVVVDGDVVAAAHNRREVDLDPTAHAELLAIRATAATLGSWRLDRATLYVTLEPCHMCAGAIVLARLPRLVFAATDPKAGAVGSLDNVVDDPRLNHRVEVTSGVLAPDGGDLLRDFFRARRR